ncbi:MAG: 50S ribosomal protein L22 [Deltaproteobacteria bacterium]|nr:50S ribosomal protein L22 [Deltaproteobacteria bacterium]
MEARAMLRYGRISPRKLREIAGLVRGQPVNEALVRLRLTHRKGAAMISKVIQSAAANAADRHGADVDSLRVRTLLVDEGPRLKRFTPRAQGRASPIKKRTSHITVVVDDNA